MRSNSVSRLGFGTLELVGHLGRVALFLGHIGRVSLKRPYRIRRLVNEVFDSHAATVEAALQCAREIATKPPVAIWGTKQAVNYARDHSVDDSLRQMGWLQGAIWSNAHVREAIAMTRDFVTSLYGAAELSVSRGRSLKETFATTRELLDPKFASFAIYEHCLPFNVSRAFDEASGIDDPVIWTAERDREMWAALQSS